MHYPECSVLIHDQYILPSIIHRVNPDMICDIHVNDPHTNIRVTHEGIRAIIRSILHSYSCVSYPVVFVLEGGYDLHSLRIW